jgi:hypothetical protein
MFARSLLDMRTFTEHSHEKRERRFPDLRPSKIARAAQLHGGEKVIEPDDGIPGSKT